MVTFRVSDYPAFFHIWCKNDKSICDTFKDAGFNTVILRESASIFGKDCQMTEEEFTWFLLRFS